jgi:hypothetical protein
MDRLRVPPPGLALAQNKVTYNAVRLQILLRAYRVVDRHMGAVYLTH